MKKANRIVSFDWRKYDQGHVVYRPAQMSGDELRLGHGRLIEFLFAAFDRRPIPGPRPAASRPMADLQHLHAQGVEDRAHQSIAAPTEAPDTAPMPPILPLKREWRAAVLEAADGTELQPHEVRLEQA